MILCTLTVSLRDLFMTKIKGLVAQIYNQNNTEIPGPYRSDIALIGVPFANSLMFFGKSSPILISNALKRHQVSITYFHCKL